jgi:hypothetical protein
MVLLALSQSVSHSALQPSTCIEHQACSDDAWTDLGGKSKEAQQVFQRGDFWRLLSVAITFLWPFFDFIYQTEADWPASARMY